MRSLSCKQILSLCQDSWNNTLTKYIFNTEKGPTDCTALFILQLVVEITNSFYMFSFLSKKSIKLFTNFLTWKCNGFPMKGFGVILEAMK